MYQRKETRKVKVGNISIGHSGNVIIQSMCNTKTYDVKNTVKQILELENAGCELVRVSVPDVESVKAIEKIKERINIPLVADIHFDHKLALMAIERGIDKIRINPGNIGDNENIKKVALACKKNKIPIRIGVNSGSLSKKILIKHKGKVTAEALYESARENILLLEKFNFHDIIVSIKSSDIVINIKACEMFAKNYKYPMHLGITESGSIKSGNIKSSVGLGILLYEGIGNTIRVSLTGNPVEEIYSAKKILQSLNLRDEGFDIVSCPTCARTNVDIEKIVSEVEEKLYSTKFDQYLRNRKKKYKVAIMGCVVNGPGEAKDADIGIAGGNGLGLLFKKGLPFKKVKEDKIVIELLKNIEMDLKTNE